LTVIEPSSYLPIVVEFDGMSGLGVWYLPAISGHRLALRLRGGTTGVPQIGDDVLHGAKSAESAGNGHALCVARQVFFTQTVVVSRRSQVDRKPAAQSREVLRSSSRRKLALIA
jgi:hypothetical protein